MRHTCTTGVTPNTQPQQILVSKAASWRSSAERRTASERTHANILGWSLRIYCCLNVPQETPVSAHLEQYFHPWPWEWSDTLLCGRKKSSLVSRSRVSRIGRPKKAEVYINRGPRSVSRGSVSDNLQSRAEAGPAPRPNTLWDTVTDSENFPRCPVTPAPGVEWVDENLGIFT